MMVDENVAKEFFFCNLSDQYLIFNERRKKKKKKGK